MIRFWGKVNIGEVGGWIKRMIKLVFKKDVDIVLERVVERKKWFLEEDDKI